MEGEILKRALAGFAALGLLLSAGAASAETQADRAGTQANRSFASDSRNVQPDSHGGEGGHLPAKEENMKLISRLQLASVPDEITDVDYHKGFAYVGTDYAACAPPDGQDTGNGVHVVNVKDPANPKKVAFIETEARNGEGIQAFKIKTRRFEGDILLISNETCDATGAVLHGGITIVDITKPRRPKVLASEVGDVDPNDFGEEPWPEPNDVHSVFGWDAGNKAYAIMTDNFEFGLLDVDILNITNPRNPKLISETGAWNEDFLAPLNAQSANGDQWFHHDVWVRKIAGEWHAMVSYWDLGWILLNVQDPKNPVVVSDTDYPAEDPLVPGFTAEGNAHQGTWSQDKQFWLGTDEDFAPFRVRALSITTGANAGDYDAAAVGGIPAPNTAFEDGVLNGPTVYGGYACPPDIYPGSTPVPQRADYDLTLAEGEEAILVIQRGPSGDPSEPDLAGGCFPGEKNAEAVEAGWDAVVFVNRHLGDAESDVPFCGSGGVPAGVVPVGGVCTTHEAFHHIFNTTPSFEVPYTGENEPEIGAEGESVSSTGDFDGWGYAHLYDADTLAYVDSYAPEETVSEEFAGDFGVLSAHEVETDRRRDKHLGYFSWYAAGARVVSFGADGMEEVGAYIHPDGNDFWGIDTIKRGKKRPLLLLSDRSYGLYVLKYTGPQ